jgi:hypothetical protein
VLIHVGQCGVEVGGVVEPHAPQHPQRAGQTLVRYVDHEHVENVLIGPMVWKPLPYRSAAAANSA